MRLVVVFTFSLLLAGCSLLDNSTEILVLSTDQQTYASGATVELVLENRSSVRYEMGTFSCASVERQAESGWQTVEPSEERFCTLQLYVLSPSERLEGSFLLHDDLDAGTYRLVQQVFRDIAEDNGIRVASNSFDVQ